MTHTIELTDTVDEAVRNAIVRPLIAYNALQTGISDHQPLIVALRDDQGEVVGGLWGRNRLQLVCTVRAACRAGVVARQADRHRASWTRGDRSDRTRVPSCVARHLRVPGARVSTIAWDIAALVNCADYPPGFSRYFMTKAF